MPFALAELFWSSLLVVTMAPPGSSRPSLTYTDQLGGIAPGDSPCLKSRAWLSSHAIFAGRHGVSRCGGRMGLQYLGHGDILLS
jgi:hypothetical protein